MLIALQGNVEVDFNTEMFDITQEDVRKSIDFAEKLNQNKKNLFKEAYLTMLKMQNLTEYDRFRDEVLSELFTTATEFGTNSEKQGGLSGKAYGIYYASKQTNTNTQSLSQKQTNTNKAKMTMK